MATSMSNLEIKMMNAGKGLFKLPSSTPSLLRLLDQMERLLMRESVQRFPSKSLKRALQPVIQALIAKELVRHPDINVNISVARCISEVIRILVSSAPYNDEQMKEFFKLAVITFENLSSASHGCYNRVTKVMKTLGRVNFSVLMSDMQMDRLIVRLFKQFLTFADSNSCGVVFKMKKIMTAIIEGSEPLNPELVNLLVSSVREENQITSPLCWELAERVLKQCAAKVRPYLRDKVPKELCSSQRNTIPLTTDISNLRKDPTRKRKLECLEGSRNLVQTIRHCICSQDEKRHEKETHSFDDPPMPNKLVTKMKKNSKIYNTRGRRVLPSVIKVNRKHQRHNTQCKKQAQSIDHGDNLVGSTIKVWWPKDEMYCQGVVKFFDSTSQKHKLLYDDGDEELLDLKREQWELVENASPISNFELTRKVSPQHHDVICVHGYRMKQSSAPVLEAIFKKYGDIAAKCAFKTTSMRASLLEIVCDVVRQIQTNDFTTVISKMEELKSHVSDAAAAKINVVWLQAHLEAIHKMVEATKNSILLMKRKANTSLVIKAGQTDLKEISAELVAAQERLEKAERCVKVIDLVEKNVTDSILEAKAEEDFWAKQPDLQPTHENTVSPQCGLACVRTYKVKQSVAPILEAIFKKHGDIADRCIFKSASVRASILEIVCKLFARVQTANVTTQTFEMKKIENQLADAEAVKVNVSWLRAHLEDIHNRKEIMEKSTLLMEVKMNIILVKRTAQIDLIERLAEVITAQERFEKAERCVEALTLVEQKLNDIIMELKAEKDSWENQLVLYVNQLMLDM